MHEQQLEQYLAGADLLRRATQGMTRDQLVARPVPGKWSTLEVVCHVVDMDLMYAERVKRALAEERPLLAAADADQWAAALAYGDREVEHEVALLDHARRQLAVILRSTGAAAWRRVGIHSSDGPLTVEELMRRVINHIPHHVAFIEEKRRALGV